MMMMHNNNNALHYFVGAENDAGDNDECFEDISPRAFIHDSTLRSLQAEAHAAGLHLCVLQVKRVASPQLAQFFLNRVLLSAARTVRIEYGKFLNLLQREPVLVLVFWEQHLCRESKFATLKVAFNRGLITFSQFYWLCRQVVQKTEERYHFRDVAPFSEILSFGALVAHCDAGRLLAFAFLHKIHTPTAPTTPFSFLCHLPSIAIPLTLVEIMPTPAAFYPAPHHHHNNNNKRQHAGLLKSNNNNNNNTTQFIIHDLLISTAEAFILFFMKNYDDDAIRHRRYRRRQNNGGAGAGMYSAASLFFLNPFRYLFASESSTSSERNNNNNNNVLLYVSNPDFAPLAVEDQPLHHSSTTTTTTTTTTTWLQHFLLSPSRGYRLCSGIVSRALCNLSGVYLCRAL